MHALYQTSCSLGAQNRSEPLDKLSRSSLGHITTDLNPLRPRRR